MSAIASRALGDVDPVEGYISGYAVQSLPAVQCAGEGRTNGYAGAINASIPAMQAGYSYGVVTASELFLVGSVGIADASGGIDFIVYPGQAVLGDFAVLFLGWETAVAGFFNAPEGWTQVETYLLGTPCAQIMYKVIDSLEPFPITNNGLREGGGYMMNVYRRGAYQRDSGRNGSTTTTVVMANISPDNVGDHVANFVVSTGTPNTINSGGVTPPQVAVNNLEGDSGSGQASIWSIDVEVTSSGAQTQPAVTPTYSTGSPSIDYAALYIIVEETGNRVYGTAAATFPAFTASGSGFITFKGSIAQVLPVMTCDAEGLILRSGRETCVSTGSANRVAIAGSSNSVVVTPSENSTVSVPIDANEVC